MLSQVARTSPADRASALDDLDGLLYELYELYVLYELQYLNPQLSYGEKSVRYLQKVF